MIIQEKEQKSEVQVIISKLCLCLSVPGCMHVYLTSCHFMVAPLISTFTCFHLVQPSRIKFSFYLITGGEELASLVLIRIESHNWINISYQLMFGAGKRINQIWTTLEEWWKNGIWKDNEHFFSFNYKIGE